MVWPLRSLRQYGHDSDIFTFESGRRGPQGVGVYSFRCTRAQQLFELVQTNVHSCQDDQTSRRISLGTIIDNPNPDPGFCLVPIERRVSASSRTRGSENPLPSPTLHSSVCNGFTNAHYMNFTTQQPPATPSSTNPTITQPYERLVSMNPGIKGEQYENVTLNPADNGCLPPVLPQSQEEDPTVSYATLELNPVEPKANKCTNSEPTNHEANNNATTNDNQSGHSVHEVRSQNGDAIGQYALINLDMTKALSDLNTEQSNSDEGIRRTRHNSTLEAISNFSANGKFAG